MMLRKRAWDMMRDEFPTIHEDGNMAEAIRVLREAMKDNPENPMAVVLSANNRLVGTISMREVLKSVKDSVLDDENLKVIGETDWDQAFKNACLLCTQIHLDHHISRDVPVVKPNDPALVVLDLFIKKKVNWVLVEEGNRIIGVILISDLYREITRDMVRVFQE